MKFRQKLSRKAKIGWFICLLLVLLIYLAFGTDLLIVDKLIYEVDVNVSHSDILRYSGLDKGVNYFFVNNSIAAKNLTRHPYVATVEARKKFPNKIEFLIEYREEFVVLEYSGLFLTLDEELNVLKVEENMGEAFLIQGFSVNSFNIGEQINVQDRDVLEHAIELIHLTEKSHIVFKPVIRYVDGSMEMELNSEFKVKFGDGHDITAKFNNFLNIYEDLVSKNINSGIIDVSNEGLPYYRPF